MRIPSGFRADSVRSRLASIDTRYVTPRHALNVTHSSQVTEGRDARSRHLAARAVPGMNAISTC